LIPEITTFFEMYDKQKKAVLDIPKNYENFLLILLFWFKSIKIIRSSVNNIRNSVIDSVDFCRKRSSVSVKFSGAFFKFKICKDFGFAVLFKVRYFEVMSFKNPNRLFWISPPVRIEPTILWRQIQMFDAILP
jgi:hypothetical protein